MPFTPWSGGGSSTATTGPQVFSVDAAPYSAKGDGQVVGDVVTNSTTTITSATANFTQADVGKHCIINGADGNATFPHIDTIASVTNSTTAALTSAALATATNCQMVWGSDDTAAIQAAVAAAKAYALANDYQAEVTFGSKIYCLASGPFQTGNGTSTITYNTQIPIPYPGTGTTQPETGRKLVFKLTGAGSSAYAQYWDSATPNITGTALVSMITAPQTIDPTFGVQSVIGGPSSGAGFTGGSGTSVTNYCNTYAQVNDIAVWCGMYTNETAFDYSYLGAFHSDRCSAHIVSVSGLDGTPAGPLLKDVWSGVGITTKQGAGLRCPLGGNNVALTCPSFTVEGYAYGVYMADHLTMERLTTVYTFIAGNINTGAGNSVCHQITIQNWDCEATQGGLRSQSGGTQPVYINMDCETAAGSVAYDVSDNNNTLFGTINWTDPADARSPTVQGGSHLLFVNNFIGPGHMASPPAVPATTVAATPVFRNAQVKITTGAGVTVSAITVDGTVTGQTVAAASTLYPVGVPSGKTIALTYAGGTPTWDWWLA